MKRKTSPEKLKNVLEKVKACIDSSDYSFSIHALDRQVERSITIPTILYVLKNGYLENRKTTFDVVYNRWKYAVRGKTVDNLDIRVVVAFDEEEMLIITVMHVI